ncbi:MAG TPA: DsrE family protein [Bacteroidales bacterium]|nr:DsrE family protein [Bacteroidales bacterium]
MKRKLFFLFVLICILAGVIYGQSEKNLTNTTKPTSIGMVIYSNDIETVWNALRLANFSLKAGDTVTIFLLGKGVELDTLVKTNEELKEQTDLFLDWGGKIKGCGTCLQSRNLNSPKVCVYSSMADLYDVVRKNKIVLTF